jgi:hypothetical protein
LSSHQWAHAKPRRSARTVDLEEEYAKTMEAGDGGDMSTVLANVKRSECVSIPSDLADVIWSANVVIPAGNELVGMWGGEWDMQRKFYYVLKMEADWGESQTGHCSYLRLYHSKGPTEKIRLPCPSER